MTYIYLTVTVSNYFQFICNIVFNTLFWVSECGFNIWLKIKFFIADPGDVSNILEYHVCCDIKYQL